MIERDDGRPGAAREDARGGAPVRAPSPEEQERLERALLALAARAAEEREDEWSAGRVLAVARRARAVASAERMPVRCVPHPPVERPVPAAPLSVAVERAAGHRCAPVLDLAAAAGAGRELWDAACESWAELPDDLPRARYVALEISGESMAPLMHSGDVVLVQLGTPLVRDTVVVARRPGEGYVVKRVGRVRRTTVELLSLNPDFPPLTIPRDDRLVVGKVVMRWSNAEPGTRDSGLGTRTAGNRDSGIGNRTAGTRDSGLGTRSE